jgi:16S rRNA A1518/A1519 N6-dimethyltransferase RsmA/KsgA/DIM1 with predicted DNA glycosylase/AP lyase activity
MLKISFAGKRKKLKNSIFSSLKIPSDKMLQIQEVTGIDLNKRPEDLELEDWLNLFKSIERFLK